MTDPFLIEGPAAVSFSGGRTSGLMLRRILDAGLQPDVHVLFADTGKEREETYDFIREVASRWAVEIHWLSRSAEEGRTPFEQLIRDRKLLPNPVTRFCTQELKIRPMRDWMRARGYEHWSNVIGLRADEPHRVARMRAANDTARERWHNVMPLAEAGLTVADVDAFWAAQPFDLRLRKWEGNCDLCFLKGIKKRERIMADRPDLAAWWIEMEKLRGATFRSDAPSYAALADRTRRQQVFPFAAPGCELDPLDGDLADCACTD